MKSFLFVILLLFSSVSSAWWNKDWIYKKKIELNTQVLTQSGLTIPDDAYALVRLHTGNFGHFLDLADNANDIRLFSGDEQTPLKFFIEKFDPINEMALIWVKLPKGLASTAEPAIWLYFGNPGAANGQDAPGSFDVSQMLTYPFSKTGIKDFTANNHNPSESSVTFSEGGLIAEAAVFDGKQSIRVPAAPSLIMQSEQGWTFTVWLKGDQAQTLDGTLLQLAPGKQNLILRIRDNVPTVEFSSSDSRQEFSATAPMDASNWHHLALVATASDLVLYVDGKPVATRAATLDDLSGEILLGNDVSGSKGFVGMVDHLTMYKIARDANALGFDVLMQGPNSTLLTYGNDASGDEEGSGSESRIMSTLKDVTVDGWVIIGLLGIMFVVSWLVMAIKAVKLNQNHSKNRKFEDAFTRLKASEIAALDEGDNEEDSTALLSMTGEHRQFSGSSIYNLYHIGVEEIKKRLDKPTDTDNQAISDKGINVVRAAMDSVLVREIQKLNGQMVLLTIAISGGPFLGLLGTVLGVMITFSDIASSGEINVNAIAPGIAAALVTTVAGLLVAIPALFGYSYLGSRIKVITADMHIFVDEFVAKLSERYGD